MSWQSAQASCTLAGFGQFQCPDWCAISHITASLHQSGTLTWWIYTAVEQFWLTGNLFSLLDNSPTNINYMACMWTTEHYTRANVGHRHCNAMALLQLPPLFWEGSPQDFGTCLQRFFPSSSTKALVSFNADVGLKGLAPSCRSHSSQKCPVEWRQASVQVHIPHNWN